MVKRRPFLLGLVLAFFLFLPSVVLAADYDILAIDVNVTLDQNGTAHFKEDWEVETSGDLTELYNTVTPGPNQEIENFKVVMDGSKPFTSVGRDWDIDESFEEKAYHNGQNDNELNWGISSYGKHHYVLTYDITNFVMKTKTTPMIYWKFINNELEDAPERASVTIKGVEPFTSKAYKVWGFGYPGRVDFKDGKIVAQNTSTLQDGQGMILLVGFPKGAYPASNSQVDESFDDVVKRAFKGSSYRYEDYKNGGVADDVNDINRPLSLWGKIMIGIVGIGIAIAIWGFSLLGISKYKQAKAVNKYYPSYRILKKRLEGEYVRELPLTSPFYSYELLKGLHIEDLEKNFFSVGLLTLALDGAIRFEDSGNRFSREPKLIVVDSPSSYLPEPVLQMFVWLQASADKSGQVKKKKLKKILKKEGKKAEDSDALWEEFSHQFLEDEDYIQPLKIVGKKTERDHANEGIGMILTDEGVKVREDWVRFSNYLQDFSLIEEKEAADVTLWDTLLIGAVALNMGEQVEKQFKDLYPNYQQESVFYGNDYDYSLTDFFIYSQLMSQNYQSGYLSTLSSSAGGGGFSSLGGGGGSFGGGGGGGAR